MVVWTERPADIDAGKRAIHFQIHDLDCATDCHVSFDAIDRLAGCIVVTDMVRLIHFAKHETHLMTLAIRKMDAGETEPLIGWKDVTFERAS